MTQARPNKDRAFLAIYDEAIERSKGKKSKLKEQESTSLIDLFSSIFTQSSPFTFLENYCIDAFATGKPFYSAACALASEGNEKAADLLLKNGANINFAIYGAGLGKKYEYAKKLIVRGASINYFARGLAQHEDLDEVALKECRKQGAHINFIAQGAAQGGHFDYVRKLLKEGAEIKDVLEYAMVGLFGQVDNEKERRLSEIEKLITEFQPTGDYRDYLARGAAIAGEWEHALFYIGEKADPKYAVEGVGMGNQEDLAAELFKPDGKYLIAANALDLIKLRHYLACGAAFAGNKQLDEKYRVSFIEGYDKILEEDKISAINLLASLVGRGGHLDYAKHLIQQNSVELVGPITKGALASAHFSMVDIIRKEHPKYIQLDDLFRAVFLRKYTKYAEKLLNEYKKIIIENKAYKENPTENVDLHFNVIRYGVAAKLYDLINENLFISKDYPNKKERFACACGATEAGDSYQLFNKWLPSLVKDEEMKEELGYLAGIALVWKRVNVAKMLIDYDQIQTDFKNLGERAIEYCPELLEDIYFFVREKAAQTGNQQCVNLFKEGLVGIVEDRATALSEKIAAVEREKTAKKSDSANEKKEEMLEKNDSVNKKEETPSEEIKALVNLTEEEQKKATSLIVQSSPAFAMEMNRVLAYLNPEKKQGLFETFSTQFSQVLALAPLPVASLAIMATESNESTLSVTTSAEELPSVVRNTSTLYGGVVTNPTVATTNTLNAAPTVTTTATRGGFGPGS